MYRHITVVTGMRTTTLCLGHYSKVMFNMLMNASLNSVSSLLCDEITHKLFVKYWPHQKITEIKHGSAKQNLCFSYNIVYYYIACALMLNYLRLRIKLSQYIS